MNRLRGIFILRGILILRGVLIVCGLQVLAACQSRSPVIIDYDVQYDYSKFQTYAWSGVKTATIPSLAGSAEAVQEKTVSTRETISTLEDQRYIVAIESVLKEKGYKKVEERSNPDFILRTHTITDKKTDATFYYSWDHYPYYYPYYYPYFSTHFNNSVVREYKIGTRILDIIDIKNSRVVWTGSISSRLGIYSNRTPQQRAMIVNTNAKSLLKHFPPENLENSQ